MRPPKTIKNESNTVFPEGFTYLAKTIHSPDGTLKQGMDVITHCKTVGLVALELIHRMPLWLKKALFPEGSELVAAAHDIGKIGPGFQEKIYLALGITLGRVSPGLDKLIGGHGAVSQAALQDVAPSFIPEIAGRHHGASPSSVGLPNNEIYGGEFWQSERLKVLEELKAFFKTDWPKIDNPLYADTLTGLSTVSDWIGSSFDELRAPSEISEALDQAGFMKPQLLQGLTFEDIFYPYHPRTIQKVLIDKVQGPGVYILEAPMGVGKTEAALLAAYNILASGQATGIYFALPTQLTSDKILDRFNQFLDAILEPDSPHKESLLLHGNAWLRKTRLDEEGRPGHSWFDARKRGMLAPFAVGTIDQALMAVMNVKHGFVRTFGLAGKVVILDEVHSYDSYTGTILDHLVQALRKLHCTVIVLSATLVLERRSELIGNIETAKDSGGSEYPLVTAVPGDAEPIYAASVAGDSADVLVKMVGDDLLAVEEALTRAERGEHVLWIENTVSDAQKYFEILGARAADLNIDCGLVHSRFLKIDRIKNESQWVRRYGKEGKKARAKAGCILVGTQVLEQSLDIDADFLVSRICPTDMVLQRIGRLWRHRENDEMRPPSARRELWLLSPSQDEGQKSIKTFGKTANVYSPFVLCRTIEIWEDKNRIRLPDQMRELIEATYTERIENEKMAKLKGELDHKKGILRRFARIGIAKGGVTLPESKAATRYSEIEAVDVLLFRNKRQEKEGVYLRLLDETLLFLPRGIKYTDAREWRKIAATLQENTVTVPEYLAPLFFHHELDFLKEYVYLGNDDEHPFRAAVVMDSGNLIGIGQRSAHEKYRLRYDQTLGFIATEENR